MSIQAQPQKLNLSAEQKRHLHSIANRVCQPGKGVLATDDTAGDLGARLEKLGVENSAESRRHYRQILYTTPYINTHISAVILIEETFNQSTDSGRRFADVLKDHNCVIGVQADSGLESWTGEGAVEGEMHSLGGDTLDRRLAEFAANGAEFAKWRAALSVGNGAPSDACIRQNAAELADYAAACQRHQLVPFVEPDVMVAIGTHTIEEAQNATERMLKAVFVALAERNVALEGIILKPNMITAGASSSAPSSPEQVAKATVETLNRCVPAAVPGIVFLSGGQSPLTATANMNAIGALKKSHYQTFCFGRAIQGPVMEVWDGKHENVKAAQKMLLHRARANGEAQIGDYESEKHVASEIAKISI